MARTIPVLSTLTAEELRSKLREVYLKMYRFEGRVNELEAEMENMEGKVRQLENQVEEANKKASEFEEQNKQLLKEVIVQLTKRYEVETQLEEMEEHILELQEAQTPLEQKKK